jgi:hypothetical protein
MSTCRLNTTQGRCKTRKGRNPKMIRETIVLLLIRTYRMIQDSSSNVTIYYPNTLIEFEITIVTGEAVQFKGSKSVMLTFEIVSDQKAKGSLMLLHS